MPSQGKDGILYRFGGNWKFLQCDAENDGCYSLETVDPLFTLAPLATDVEHSLVTLEQSFYFSSSAPDFIENQDAHTQQLIN